MPQPGQSMDSEKLVLIVDDVRLNREILGQMIRGMGLEVAFACTGEEAIEKFIELQPSLILMDINMPGMDGIEATRRIKALAEDRFIPVIFVTGAEGQDVIRNAIGVGGDDYIQRPFPFELLEGKIIALRRIAELYRQVNQLYYLRAREEEVAEQLLSGAVESSNVALDQVRIHKQPAETFSGDVLLTAFRPNGELNVLLGDFTGHGLTSTVGALPLSETFRAMTTKGYDAEDILAQINRKLQRLLPTGMFLACGMVTLAHDGSAKIWNGGLPDILVISQGRLLKRVLSNHPPLGIVANLHELHFEHTQLEPEDRILLLSDGVLEAEDAEGEQFGEERLLAAVAALGQSSDSCLVDLVLKGLYDFVGSHTQKDDISMIDVPGRVTAQGFSAEVASESGVEPDDAALDTWNWSLELQGKSLARINPVAQALSRLQETEGGGDHWHSVFSILTELYVNALDHGVLKLESSMKSSPEGFASYFSEREKRMECLNTGSVSLFMQHTRLSSGGRLMVRVEDSGDGFDYDHWLSKRSKGDNMFSGRGIALVTDLCEKVHYENGGSAVEIVYNYTVKK
ncbi:SpoIIE family protein phosphatase [Neptuniibacter halophilus]|uniref:SpoIIE family protein phosphatase n=1 Tax=Neptuniibacter halophilus TaxID=651666 RepID=UPI0025729E07|nr:SpoIIE family protein phosphatase [Neptuniibacter halophilus]